MHEQSRCDRDSFVKIHYENIQTGMESHFDRFCEYDGYYLWGPTTWVKTSAQVAAIRDAGIPAELVDQAADRAGTGGCSASTPAAAVPMPVAMTGSHAGGDRGRGRVLAETCAGNGSCCLGRRGKLRLFEPGAAAPVRSMDKPDDGVNAHDP